jgi:methyl-accepting chemotaxis protein
MKFINNLKIRTKILGSFLIVVIASAVVTYLGASGLGMVAGYIESLYSDRLVPIEQLSQAQSLMYTIRGDYYKIAAVKSEQAKYLGEMNDNLGSIDAVMNSYKAANLLESEKEGLVAFDKAFTEFSSALSEYKDKVSSGDDTGAMSLISGDGRVVAAREGLGDTLSVLISINDKEAERLRNEGRSTKESRTLLMYAVGTFGSIAGIIIAFLISSSLTSGIKILITGSRSMSGGDLLRDMNEKEKEDLTS